MSEDKKYWVECIVCHEQFDMTWGQEDNICDSCNGKKAEEMHEEKEIGSVENFELGPLFEIVSQENMLKLEEALESLNAALGYYANPDNWKKSTVTGYGADGEMTEEIFYRGDGGELARKFWRG